MMNLNRLWKISALLAASCFGFCLQASGTVIEHEDWITGDNGDRALEVAQERNLPIAVIYTFYDTT